ncbi:hypothetical protein BH10ACT1_BH10ACT1_18940 [soil metagenome]
MDVTAGATDPNGWRQRGTHLLPFASLVLLAYALALFPPHAPNAAPVLATAGVCFLLVAAMAVTVPWSRLPDGSALVPVVVACFAIGLVRHAVGGNGAYGGLLLLPVIWQALHGRRFELAATIGAVAATYAVPIAFIGGDAYPAGQWRAAVLATMTAATVGLVVEHLNRLREHLLEQASNLAGHDELTGLVNRRSVSQALAEEVDSGRTGVLAMLDLDHFKAFNDEHGHLAGDDLLSATADAWRSVMRRGDTLARWGGEEFVVLFPASTLDQACRVLQRMAAVTPEGLTFSGGVVRMTRGQRSVDVLTAADELLYEAKAEGRNRIVTEQDTVDRSTGGTPSGPTTPSLLAVLTTRV